MRNYVVVLLLFFNGIGFSQFSPSSLIEIKVEDDIFTPQQYVVYQTQEKITIDGKAKEKAWANVPYTSNFIDIEGIKTPKYTTQVKMLWDETYLYIYADMEEPHIWADLTEHDAVIFYNNDFEVFIDPTDDTYDYSEIEVNALNTTWDLKLNKPYRMGGRADNYYEITGLKTAVDLRGTLNNARDIDSAWSVEIAIPLEVVMRAFRGFPKAPKEGDYWRINFSRVQWEHDITNGKYSRKKVNDKFLPEYNWVWSNQKAINMHIPERWGFIEFSKNSPIEKKDFTPIPNLISKQVAYSLMRQIKFGKHKNLLASEIGLIQKIAPFKTHEQSFECTFMKTNFGFEINIHNLSHKTHWVINEMGIIKK